MLLYVPQFCSVFINVIYRSAAEALFSVIKNDGLSRRNGAYLPVKNDFRFIITRHFHRYFVIFLTVAEFRRACHFAAVHQTGTRPADICRRDLIRIQKRIMESLINIQNCFFQDLYRRRTTARRFRRFQDRGAVRLYNTSDRHDALLLLRPLSSYRPAERGDIG